MITVSECANTDSLEWILDDPEIYASLCDDSCPDRCGFTLKMSPDGTVFYAVEKDGSECGFISFIPISDGVYEQHTVLSKECRGRDAVSAAFKASELVEKNHNAREIISFCFSDKPNTLFFASALGFSRTGVETDTKRNGCACRKIMLKKDLICQS